MKDCDTPLNKVRAQNYIFPIQVLFKRIFFSFLVNIVKDSIKERDFEDQCFTFKLLVHGSFVLGETPG